MIAGQHRLQQVPILFSPPQKKFQSYTSQSDDDSDDELTNSVTSSKSVYRELEMYLGESMGSVPRCGKVFFLVPDLSFSGSTELKNTICEKRFATHS